MKYFKEIEQEQGKPFDYEQYITSLQDIATHMYENGFTVIPSYGKSPNIVKWKDESKESLYNSTLLALEQDRANSINIRLDNELMAIDVDTPLQCVTDEFVRKLKLLFGAKLPLYTVRGGKGLKIFFKCLDKDLTPNRLGNIFHIAHHNNTYKHEIEIKKLLSTVAGVYPCNEGAIYDSYPNTMSITSAKLDDLPLLTLKDLELIKKAYHMAVVYACIQKGYYLTNHFEKQALNGLKVALKAYNKYPKFLNEFLDFFATSEYAFINDFLAIKAWGAFEQMPKYQDNYINVLNTTLTLDNTIEGDFIRTFYKQIEHVKAVCSACNVTCSDDLQGLLVAYSFVRLSKGVW